MAWRRTFNRRKTWKKRRTFKRKVAKPVKSYVRRAIRKYEAKNVETKLHTISSGLPTPFQAAFHYENQLTAVAQGAGGNSRIGNRIRWKSVRVHLKLQYQDSGTTNLPSSVRVLVLQVPDKLTATANLLPQLLTVDPATASTEAQTCFYQQVTLQEKRFRILKDFRMTVSSENPINMRNLNIRGFDKNMTYDPGYTTGAGHIYLCFAPMYNLGTGYSDCTMQWDSLVSFTDA